MAKRNQKSCKCADQMDAALESHNARLSRGFSINFASGTATELLYIATENITQSRKKPKAVVATYCPFCGRKLPA